MSPSPASRGGATGKAAKIMRPIPPEMSIALRVRRYPAGWAKNSQSRTTAMTGQ
jgi:hypothetical protein